MSKTLAIKGDKERGNEVIALLEMLGGNTFNSLMENVLPNRVYYIGNNNAITWTNIYSDNGCLDTEDFFTLEEFLKKFPYKVGDKVHIYVQNDDIDGRYDIDAAEIISMRWNPARRKIAYKMKNINREFYKEEIKCKVDDDHTEPSKMKNVLAELFEHIKTTPKEELEKEFKEIEEWSNVGPTIEEFMAFCESINKKPAYPKTYKECCDVLYIVPFYNLRYHTYERGVNEYATSNELLSLQDKLNDLGKLLLCRKAYWKIAGEQMGLGKPWKPDCISDWITEKQINYGLYNELKYSIINPSQFVFPTEEMRDAFYENFKDLIEQCKELL